MQRSLPLRYGAAVALGIVALLLSLLTGPLPGSSPFLLFGASVVLSAWFGGLGPGLLAAVLGGLGSAYLSLPPPRAPLTVSPADAVRLLILLLIAVVVSWAAGEVRRAQDTLRVQARQQAAVAQLGQRALENAPLGVLMDEAVALVAHTLAVEYCKILELLPGGREFLLRAGTGWEPGLVGTMRVPAESGLQSGYSLRAEQPVIIRDLRTETRFKGSALLEGHHVVSGMTVIIRGEGGPFGVLGAHSVAPRVFTQDDVNFLQAMANVLATAIRRAAAEETLRAQRESLQVTLDSIGDAVIAIDASNNVTFVNPVAARLTGWSQEEAAGKPLAQVFPIVNEETRQPVENPAERVIREGKVSGLANHTLLLARNGAEIPIGDTAAPIHDERGNLVGVVLVFRDITERRRAEKELRESRDQLEIILKDAADAITVQAPDGHLLFANDAAAQTIGFASAQELVNTPVLQTAQRFEIMDEEGRPLPLDQLPGRLALQGGQPPERVIRSRVLASGEERVSVVKATPVFDARGQVQFAINIFHDITERRRGEEVVRQQREWLRVTLASIGDAVIATDTQGRVTFMNPIAEALTGWPEGEAAGLNLSAVFRIFNEETRQEAENPVARVLREGAVVGLANHTILIARDGEEKQIDDSAAPIRDDRGQVIGVVMVFRDIRERRARERRRTAQYAVTRVLAEAQTLDEASRGLLSALGASLGWEYGALWNVDPEAHALHCVETWHTPAAEFPEFEAATRGRTFASGIGMPGRIWNQAEPAWLGEPAEDDNFPRAEAARADGLRSGFGLPILLGGRVLGVIEFYSRAPRAPDPDLLNELSGLGSQFGQFVERQRAEQAVRESEARQSAILESAMDAVITMNHLGSIVEINPAAEKIFRYRRDEMLGKQLADLLIPSSRRQEHGLGLQHYLATGEGQFLDRRVELTARRADGGEFPIELAVTRIRWNGPALFTAYVRDVTEQKRAEAALSHLAAIVESADAAIISKSLENRILSWNPAAERLYGYAAAEVIGQPVSILYPPDRQEELARLTAQVERGEPVENYETVRVHKDGRRIEVAVSLSALKDREGRLIGASGIERDITERKHAAERIRFQSNILENVRDSVVVMDRQDTIVYWNEGAAAVFGYSADEMVGRSPERLHPVSEPERFLAALKDLMTRGDYAGEWHAPRKGGARVWVDIKVSPMADAEGNALGYVSVAKDIADRKRAEEEQSLLAQASDLLAGSLDYSTTLVRVAQLAVPKVADWCSVDIVEPDGTYKTLALAHADPAKAAWGRELQRRYPPDPNAATGVAEVMRTGKSQLVPDISEELLARSTQDPELLRILQELGLKSVMTVPLIARGRALGAITFVAAESNHHFGPANLAFAEELARRAAIAVDNARLYQNEQQARRSAEHAADRTARLQTVTATLAEALEPEQVVDLVIRQGLAAMNARSGLVALVNPEHTMIQVVNQVG